MGDDHLDADRESPDNVVDPVLLAASTAEHVIAQVGRVLDAHVRHENASYRVLKQVFNEAEAMAGSILEIKGLGNAVRDVRGHISGIRALAADVSVSGTKLKASLEDVKKQIEDAQSDIEFEAQTLGNSGKSDDSSDSSTSQAGGEARPTQASAT